MLEGKSFWITRPEGQAEKLKPVLEDAGANVKLLPMLVIESVPVDAKIKSIVLNLDKYDLLFFISTNAATLGMELINNYWPQFPQALKIFAVGPTTADVISSYDLQAEFPVERMSSEALLALESLSDVSGKKALIVRGVGGRELLATALKEKGVSVDYLELYQRVCPDYKAGKLAQLFRDTPPDGIIVSSSEALDNLVDLLARDKVALTALPLFVSSERIAGDASTSGFKKTITMSGADDRAIIHSLNTYFNTDAYRENDV